MTNREVTEGDLADLPTSVATYLRRAGAVGRPRIVSVRAKVSGRIRAGEGDSWMSFTGAQVNGYLPEPRRHFHITARRAGIPVTVEHSYIDGHATMSVKALSLLRIQHAHGPDLDRAETVTVLNDMCVLAPAALVDADVAWTDMGPRAARATYTNEGITVAAMLHFDGEGDLVDFVSDDRLRMVAGDRKMVRQRWSTPLCRPRSVEGRRLMTAGEGRWHPPAPEREFAYLEIEFGDVDYDD